MTVEAIQTPYGETLYRASIKQKGVSVSLSGRTRYEAITKAWQEYTYWLYK